MKIFKVNIRSTLRGIALSLVSIIFGGIVGYCVAEIIILSSPSRPHWAEHLRSTKRNETLYVQISGYNPQTYAVHGRYPNVFDDKSQVGSFAEKLFEDIRVLCWIMTSPSNHIKKARHIKYTWGRRCNKLLFMSTEADEDLQTIALNVSEGHYHLWAKTKAAFQYVYEHHFDEADWFLKADDDCYVVMENLRYMLYAYTPETALFFGHKYRRFPGKKPITGGPSYILSKEALRRFVLEALPNPYKCRGTDGGSEDFEMAKCLTSVNVIAGETRDERGRERFLPIHIYDYIVNYYQNKGALYWTRHKGGGKEIGLDCCSDHAVSFHYVPPTKMYLLDYVLYNLRPYGIVFKDRPLP